MSKAFEQRRLVKVYLEQKQFEELTRSAQMDKKTVSEYMRDMVQADIDATDEFSEPEAKNVKVPKAVVKSLAVAAAPKKHCQHGKEFPRFCFECHGVAGG